jgi:hypothetical protein
LQPHLSSRQPAPPASLVDQSLQFLQAYPVALQQQMEDRVVQQFAQLWLLVIPAHIDLPCTVLRMM